MGKYFAKTTSCNNGHSHASKREAKRCNELHLLQMGREIEGLCIEPKFTFTIAGKPLMMLNNQPAQYRPDFAYLERGKLIAEDVKGMVVRDFPLRAALFRACFPEYELRVVK